MGAAIRDRNETGKEGRILLEGRETGLRVRHLRQLRLLRMDHRIPFDPYPRYPDSAPADYSTDYFSKLPVLYKCSNRVVLGHLYVGRRKPGTSRCPSTRRTELCSQICDALLCKVAAFSL